jgi:catechol 2,3-dioxygenase-like lactoylglutathione lyase family enzyme
MMMLRLAPLALLAGCATATAQTSPPPARTSPGVAAPAQRIPTDVRRVTMIVRSIENSMRLYRDVLGLQVNYDSEVTMSGVALPAGEPGARARLVLLNGNDSFIGWIGLMEWLQPRLPDPGPYLRRMGIGSHVIIVNTDDVAGRCARAAQVPGVTVTSAPRLQTYPGRNGGPPIRVMGCNVLDPDGTLLEINQLLS